MQLNIRNLKIKNYRGINDLELLIPENGVLFGDFLMGKTSIFESICLALGSERWLSPLTADSFYRGMVNFEEFLEADSILIQLVLSGFSSKEEISEMFGDGTDISPCYFDPSTKEYSFEKGKGNSELAVELVFAAEIDESGEIFTKRFVASQNSTYSVKGAEPECKVNVGDAIGFFYIPFKTSNNRKWLEKHLHEAIYEVEQWKHRAINYLDMFQKSHDAMIKLMDELEEKKKTNVSEDELSKEVVSFVTEHVQKIESATTSAPVKKGATKSELLKSFEGVIETADLRIFLQIVGAHSYNFYGECVLGTLINEVLGRLQQKLPCKLFIDEPEAFFEEGFFWKKFIERVNEDPNMTIVFATHMKKIFEEFPESSRVFIHNVFGSVSIMDEALFSGLYQ